MAEKRITPKSPEGESTKGKTSAAGVTKQTNKIVKKTAKKIGKKKRF
jgi:hypothetical protein